MDALEQVFTGDDIRAKQRVDLILQALRRYQPELDGIRGVGFCAGVKHAHFMAHHLNQAGIRSAVVVGTTAHEEREACLRQLRSGQLTFLFTVDVLSEGVDIPEINLVLFLRPTESLTVFLQQLGRGLRHAPGKECLTVLDFVGQTHRLYRLDTRNGRSTAKPLHSFTSDRLSDCSAPKATGPFAWFGNSPIRCRPCCSKRRSRFIHSVIIICV